MLVYPPDPQPEFSRSRPVAPASIILIITIIVGPVRARARGAVGRKQKTGATVRRRLATNNTKDRVQLPPRSSYVSRYYFIVLDCCSVVVFVVVVVVVVAVVGVVVVVVVVVVSFPRHPVELSDRPRLYKRRFPTAGLDNPRFSGRAVLPRTCVSAVSRPRQPR